MKFNISTYVLRETIKCPNNFSCLLGGQVEDSGHCEVKWADGQNELLLETKKTLSCPYRSFKSECEFCTCPTRFAIYKKYRQ